MTFREWLDNTYWKGFDPSDLSEEEYYELEDRYAQEMSAPKKLIPPKRVPTKDEMIKSMDDIIAFYKLIEQEYGINLTEEVYHAERVKEDIPEAVWKAEHKEIL